MIGEKLGSFRIEAVLGTGAMGVVYRGVHESTGRTAAVKVISREIASRGSTYERFRRESEILQQFRHPNIVRFLAVGRYQGTSYFAMEYVHGETLEHVLQRRGPLHWREVVALGIQICEALHYAHEHSVVHRDLKPSNLMVSDKGQVKLTDFGIAKDLDATALTATGRTLGTAAYMAPEQIRGTPEVSHKTDLYALGVVFYQMLTGQSPFGGGSAVVLMHCHLNEPAPRPSAKVAEIPRALDDLVIQLMAKAPSDRPWDAAAVGVSLTELRDKADRGEAVAMVWTSAADGPTQPIAPPPDDPGRKPRKGGRRRRESGRAWLSRASAETLVLVLALVAISGFLGYMLWPPGQAYLYAQAARLMASSHRHDWLEARDSYLDPLDRRFPHNPYKDQSRAWRDRILLDEAEGRARVLRSAVHTSLSEPHGKLEELFVFSNAQANEEIKAGNDRGAAQVWEEMARQLRLDDPDERKWGLLARKLADDLRAEIERRRELVASQLAQAEKHDAARRPVAAAAIRKELRDRYGKYTDVADLLGPATVPAPTSTPSPSSSPATPPDDRRPTPKGAAHP